MVANVAGRLLLKQDESYAPGTTLFGVDTGGWSAGTYIVTMRINGRSVSQRIEVVDR